MYTEIDEVIDAIIAQQARDEGATHYMLAGGDALFLYRPARGVYEGSGLYAQTVRTRLQEWRENPWVVTGDGALPKGASACA